MKRGLILLGLLLGLAAGCEQPSDIELNSDPQQASLEVIPLKVPDTLVAVSPIDTSGVLPLDQLDFWGRFLVHHVTVDGGPGNRASFAYSSVLMSDSVVRSGGMTVGFSGISLGMLTVNGIPMVEIPHRIRLRRLLQSDTVWTSGVEYLADLSATYAPDADYIWTSNSIRYGRFDLSIRAPEDLAVLKPVGGTIYSRDRDIPLAWVGGKGVLTIILSAYDRVTKRVHPLLELRPNRNTGRALIPSSLVRQLPKRQDFVFTFILSNRREISLTQASRGRILVQAASVFSTYIQIQ
jgi:hypothetical protein